MTFRNLVPWRKAEPEKQEALHPFAAMQRDMNRMFDRMWSGGGIEWPEWAGENLGAFVPNIEVSETDKLVEVSAELPGMKAEDIDVTLSPDATLLTLKGEKKYEKEDKNKDYYRTERAYGSFRRTVALPCPVVADTVESVYKDGVLELKLHKSEAPTGAKRIPIK